MNSDDIRNLRKELNITQRQLAEALKIEVELVREWERDEHFPTRLHCTLMTALRKNPPAVVPRGKAQGTMQVLADPKFFGLVRKLLGHAKLRAEVEKLAAAYPDPAEE